MKLKNADFILPRDFLKGIEALKRLKKYCLLYIKLKNFKNNCLQILKIRYNIIIVKNDLNKRILKMTLNELIEILNKMKEENGEKEVKVQYRDDGGDYYGEDSEIRLEVTEDSIIL